MKIKNKILAATAVGALCAAAAVPALAFENEFHGMFLTQGIASNLYNGTTGSVAPNNMNLHTNKTFVDQRVRLQYIAKASDDLKLVTHFEIDGRWGDNSYAVGRNQGMALGGDNVNLETKNVYLDFNCPITGTNVKLGLQGWTDAYKGVFLGNDAAGLALSKKFGAGTYGFGFFRLDDSRRTSGINGTVEPAGYDIGKPTRDFLYLDAAYALSKDAKIGASYYYYNDDVSVLTGSATTSNTSFTTNNNTFVARNIQLNMLGVNGSANVGPVTLDGFFLYQNGVLRNFSARSQHQSAFAYNLGAKVKAGVGTVKANILYTSGSNLAGSNYSSSFISAMNETSSAYMESGIFSGANSCLIFRGNGYRTSNTDQSIVADPSYRGAGVAAAFIGYDGAMGKSFFNVNTAFVMAAKKQYTSYFAGAYNSPYANKAQYLGTEINAEVGYKLYDNLKASVQGAYVFLGPQFEGAATVYPGTTTLKSIGGDYPNNPYLGRVIVSYAF